MKIIVFGGTGMAGHVIALYLKEIGHDVLVFARKKIFENTIIGDVKNSKKVKDTIRDNNFDYIINCVGILNEKTEENKLDAIYTNSLFPHLLVDFTSAMNTKVITLSTDCVFSGDKGNYTETSIHDGISFYDKTKSLGEIKDNKNLTFRNSIIGPELNERGVGLFNWFMNQKGEIKGYKNVFWNGVTTIVLARAIAIAMEINLTGIYHLVNDEGINKYDLLNLFNKYFNKKITKITPCTDIKINKILINSRDDFNFDVPTYEAMVIEMKEWIDSHKEYYQHYF